MIVELRHRMAEYTDLSPRQEYPVLGIEGGELRVLNDRGRPFLYPRSIFRVVDATRPRAWIVERGDDGETYAYPPALNGAGFFEDFFDDRPGAVTAFWKHVNESATRGARRTSRSRTNPAASARRRAS